MSAFSLRSAPEKRICRIEISRIEKSPYQPRRVMDEAGIRQLAESFRRFGQLTPILVRRKGTNYELIAGERRLHAMKMIGGREIEAIITAAFDRDCALMALIENIEREDIHYIDQAEACKRLLREQGLTQEELAAAIGKSQGALANMLRILRLEPGVLDILRESELTERHARALLKLPEEGQKLRAIEHICRLGMSVARTEQYIAGLLEAPVPDTQPDVAAFLRGVNQTLNRIQRSGIAAISERRETDRQIVLTITIPK